MHWSIRSSKSMTPSLHSNDTLIWSYSNTNMQSLSTLQSFQLFYFLEEAAKDEEPVQKQLCFVCVYFVLFLCLGYIVFIRFVCDYLITCTIFERMRFIYDLFPWTFTVLAKYNIQKK
eukprot:281181_1